MMTASIEEEKRFTMGTLDKAWRTIVATWDLVPKKRIRENVERFTTTLEAIIADKGVFVKGYDLRYYHR